MGPKKSAKNKNKKKKDESSEAKDSEFKYMATDVIREMVPMLSQHLDKAMLDRNYKQLDRVSKKIDLFDYFIFNPILNLGCCATIL